MDFEGGEMEVLRINAPKPSHTVRYHINIVIFKTKAISWTRLHYRMTEHYFRQYFPSVFSSIFSTFSVSSQVYADFSSTSVWCRLYIFYYVFRNDSAYARIGPDEEKEKYKSVYYDLESPSHVRLRGMLEIQAWNSRGHWLGDFITTQKSTGTNMSMNYRSADRDTSSFFHPASS